MVLSAGVGSGHNSAAVAVEQAARQRDDVDEVRVLDVLQESSTLYRDPTSELVTAIEDPGGRAFDLTYDANGHLETVTGPDAAEVAYTYDANGDLIAVDKPEDGRTEYVYAKHHLTEIRQRQGDDLGSSSMVTVLTNTLDTVNRVVEQTDGAEASITFAYLAGPDQGVTRVTDPLDEEP